MNHETIQIAGDIYIRRRYDAWYPMRKTGTGNLAFLHGPEDKHDGSELSARNIAAKHIPSTPNASELDPFTRAYIECALWSSTDDQDQPMDANYTVSDLAPETLARMVEDCRTFQARFGDTLTSDNCPNYHTSVDSQAGHDFWLTRNGHGCGFWDGDWEEPAATMLTDGSKQFGECQLYVGDDGRIYA